jgi:subtilisin family serine protease
LSVSQLSDNSSSATNNLEQLGKYGRVVKRINRGTDLVVASDLTNKVTPGSPQVAALSNTEPDSDFCKNLISAGLAETCTPNYKLSILQTSERDPLSSLLWGLGDSAGIAAESGWGISQGSRQVVVAVIDTGIDYTHEDLANNIWTNPFERPGNGLDDDGNGVIDDVHGARFISAGITGDPLDDNQHGTHVAGTIGAVHGNGLGVRGSSVCHTFAD